MPRFDPQPGQQIKIGTVIYTFTPHPVVPSMVFGQEGRKAVVYQVKNNGSLYALKVFKPKYQDPSLVETCRHLGTITVPGMEVCLRSCITRAIMTDLLNQYPEMEYAIFMPWIQGSTWFDVIVSGTALSLDACKMIARNTAQVLLELEKRSLSHCDVAGGNVVVDTMTGKVSFIDVEDMYGPDLPEPKAFPQGTEGYQHKVSRTNTKGQWCAAGDRFSAAVLLSEMLVWYNPKIRQCADEEHFFPDGELQDPQSANYNLMLTDLGSVSKRAAELFDQAWLSKTLEECSQLSEWAKVLEFPLVSEWNPIIAPPPPQPYRPKFEPLVVPVRVIGKQEFHGIPAAIPTIPPDIPPLFRHNLSDHTLQWFTARGAEEYEIQVADDEKFMVGMKTFRETGNVWQIPDHFQRNRYFRIRAVNSIGPSKWSNTVIIH